MKRKKKKWTTKNTHLERKEKREDYDKDFAGWVAKVGIWMILIGAIIFIIEVAFNNHIVGYDHFIGIPREWVRSLFK